MDFFISDPDNASVCSDGSNATCTDENDIQNELDYSMPPIEGDSTTLDVADMELDGAALSKEEYESGLKILGKMGKLPDILSTFRRRLPELHAEQGLGPLTYCDLSRKRSSVDLRRICHNELNYTEHETPTSVPGRVALPSPPLREPKIVKDKSIGAATASKSASVPGRVALPSPPRRKPQVVINIPTGAAAASKGHEHSKGTATASKGHGSVCKPAILERPRKIARHVDRGVDTPSAKDVRDAEDRACNAGMRNPAAVCDRWPELISAMAEVRRALLQVCEDIPELRDLPLAVGDNPDVPPPSDDAIKEARRRVGVALGIPACDVDAHHSAGKWRYNIVKAIQARCGDPDSPLVEWLKTGSPMGILHPITPGGLFPVCESPAEALTLEGLLWQKGNHPSFGIKDVDDGEPPGLALLREYYRKGFASRYTSLVEARAEHGDLVISPLGTITKTKADGSLKHRIIQDLRRGGANLLASHFERIVLPRPNDHGWDLFHLWLRLAEKTLEKDAGVWSLIIDFKDAFMSTGTRKDEQRFTAAAVADDESPSGTYIYVWHTLGFGGKTFPLVYARPASFAARTAQALVPQDRVRSQLYVDDPAIAMVGTKAWALREGTLPLLWWLVLGLDLAWRKGYFGVGRHDWIGVSYNFTPDGVTMELPTTYIEQTIEALKPLTSARGTVSVKQVQKSLGKAARIAYILPDTSAFIASMWAGYRAGCRQLPKGTAGTFQNRLPVRRFSVAAKWFSTLLEESLKLESRGTMALTRVMGNSVWKLQCPYLPRISFDASPWGGGGILWLHGRPDRYTHFTWSSHTLGVLRAEVGSCKFQTIFEFFTLFMVCLTFASSLENSGAVILGDNLASLNEALNLKSTVPIMNTVARELAWRKIAMKWQYKLEHLPAELNDEADCLSRLFAVPSKPLPQEELRGAHFVTPPAQNEHIWKARIVVS